MRKKDKETVRCYSVAKVILKTSSGSTIYFVMDDEDEVVYVSLPDIDDYAFHKVDFVRAMKYLLANCEEVFDEEEYRKTTHCGCLSCAHRDKSKDTQVYCAVSNSWHEVMKNCVRYVENMK